MTTNTPPPTPTPSCDDGPNPDQPEALLSDNGERGDTLIAHSITDTLRRLALYDEPTPHRQTAEDPDELVRARALAQRNAFANIIYRIAEATRDSEDDSAFYSEPGSDAFYNEALMHVTSTLYFDAENSVASDASLKSALVGWIQTYRKVTETPLVDPTRKSDFVNHFALTDAQDVVTVIDYDRDQRRPNEKHFTYKVLTGPHAGQEFSTLDHPLWTPREDTPDPAQR